jgi:hypothetical protein
MHARAEERYARMGPRVLVRGLADGRVDVGADAYLSTLYEGPEADAGVSVLYEPTDDPWAIDGSVRLLVSDAGTDWYADLFLDVLGWRSWALVAGAFAEGATDQGFYDQAEGGYLKASWRAP